LQKMREIFQDNEISSQYLNNLELSPGSEEFNLNVEIMMT